MTSLWVFEYTVVEPTEKLAWNPPNFIHVNNMYPGVLSLFVTFLSHGIGLSTERM